MNKGGKKNENWIWEEVLLQSFKQPADGDEAQWNLTRAFLNLGLLPVNFSLQQFQTWYPAGDHKKANDFLTKQTALYLILPE